MYKHNNWWWEYWGLVEPYEKVWANFGNLARNLVWPLIEVAQNHSLHVHCWGPVSYLYILSPDYSTVYPCQLLMNGVGTFQMIFIFLICLYIFLHFSYPNVFWIWYCIKSLTEALWTFWNAVKEVSRDACLKERFMQIRILWAITVFIIGTWFRCLSGHE